MTYTSFVFKTLWNGNQFFHFKKFPLIFICINSAPEILIILTNIMERNKKEPKKSSFSLTTPDTRNLCFTQIPWRREAFAFLWVQEEKAQERTAETVKRVVSLNMVLKCKLHEGSGFASVHCYKQCLVHTERRKGGREGMTRCPVPLSTLLSTDRLSSRARAQGCGSTEPGMWQ